MDNRFDIKSNLLETYNINCITRTITENIGFHGHDFYELEIGTAGMMRAYMVCRCTADFSLERKISRFLEMSLSVFRVPEDERARIIAHVATLDVRALARRVMGALFESLSMEFAL